MGDPHKLSNLFQVIPGRLSSSERRGQSFLELALVLPILLIMLLGLVEVVIFIGRYLDLLDLTREAARFASVRDPDPSTFTIGLIQDCGNPNYYNFYFSAACVLSPPDTNDKGKSPDTYNAELCPLDLNASRTAAGTEASSYCNGLNPYVYINPATDDVVISVFTVTSDRYATTNKTCPTGEDQCVTGMQPAGGPWALSNNDADTDHNDNWTRNCDGEEIRSEPYYTVDRVNTLLTQNDLLPGRGFVAIEVYYCYHQVLNIPIFTAFVPNPLQIHAYTIMPLPAAQPTPTNVP